MTPTPFRRRRADGSLYPHYYIAFRMRGRRYLFCTKTANLATARANGGKYYESIKSEAYHMAEAMKSGGAVPTLARVFKAYLEEIPLAIGHRSRTGNVQAAKQVLAIAGLSDQSRLDQLSEKLVVMFQQRSLAQDYSPATINSRLRCFKACFSRRAMQGYRGIGLDVNQAWIAPLVAAPGLQHTQTVREIPDDALVAGMHKELRADLPQYRAFLLAAYAGLRAIEIINAKWSWLSNDILYVGAEADYSTKTGKWRPVRLDPTVLAALLDGPRDGEYIVGAEANNLVRRVLSKRLKSLGFTADNPLHSLRRWFGSHLAAGPGGLRAAQLALGHTTPATTHKHYAAVLAVPAALAPVVDIRAG